ncbi:MAG: hypothetical protein DCC56_08380 [Anaerolineae bacterium]|nr:MAG: hypothetical protein DCC56_08380 [Anaerolineae bacterium]WKZ45395.1 MAG: hypothetical protein QY302_06350 [Anaerolineales bacterium]
MTSRIIPIYTSQGDAEAFLLYPHIFNRLGEWIGWITPQREVYSVMGYFVGTLTSDPRIVRKRSDDADKPRQNPPPPPGRIAPPAQIPLAPMMQDFTHSLIDVLLDEPERLHTIDSGEMREDMD